MSPGRGSVAAKRLRIGCSFGWKCAYCESEVAWGNAPDSVPATAQATIDHVVPLVAGGAFFLNNEVLACRRCNSGKRDKTLSDWLECESCPVSRWRSFGFLVAHIEPAAPVVSRAVPVAA